MTSPMDPRSDRLMQRLLGDDLDVDSQEIAEQRARDPEFARAVDAWQRAATTIDGVAQERRELVDQARREIDDHDVDVARRFLEARVAARRRRPLLIGAAIAAAAVIAVLTQVPFTPRDPVTPSNSGRLSTPVDAHPVGAVSSITHISLGTPLPRGGTMRVEVYDLEAPRDADPVVVSELLSTSRWELTASQQEQLPRRIRWVADVWDGGGQRLRPVSAEAWLDDS